MPVFTRQVRYRYRFNVRCIPLDDLVDEQELLLVALPDGLKEDPAGAIGRMLGRVHAMMLETGVEAPLRFTAALTDGATLWAFRWASDDQPPTLYWRQDSGGLIVVSEPIDTESQSWHAVPSGHFVLAEPGEAVAVGALVVPEPALA